MIKKLDHFVLTVKNIEKTTLLKKENAQGILFLHGYISTLFNYKFYSLDLPTSTFLVNIFMSPSTVT